LADIIELRPEEQQPAGGEEFLSLFAGFFVLNIITNGSLKSDNTFFTQLKQQFGIEC